MERSTSLSLLQLLEIANEAYPDGFLGLYFERSSGNPKDGQGDSLARFVVAELSETFQPGLPAEKQLEEARFALERAIEAIHDVIVGLHRPPDQGRSDGFQTTPS